MAELAALPPAGLAAGGLVSLGARSAVMILMNAARELAMLVECSRNHCIFSLYHFHPVAQPDNVD